jgi:hypothetical protein
MGAKKYRYIGNENQSRAYGGTRPILGKVYPEGERIGTATVEDWANHLEYEWEEVIDEVANSQTQPAHYKQGKVECIEAIKSAVVNKTGEEAVLVGNVIKYLWRYESKGGITDVEKAIWYINHLKQLLDETRNKV